MPAGFGYASQPSEITLQQRLREVNSFLSIRQISELSGVSFGSVQGILSGRTVNPRELTLARLEGALGDLPTFRVDRNRTSADDRPLWSADDLSNLVPPIGARNVKLVVYSPNTGTGAATTRWYPTAEYSPLDALADIGAHPSVVRRVIWER